MLNKIEIEGILDKEPKHAKTTKGHSMCKLFMKISTSYPGNAFVKISYVPIVAWGQVADTCTSLKQNDEVRIEGMLEFQTWETISPSGEKVKKGALSVKAERVNKIETPMPDIKIAEEEEALF